MNISWSLLTILQSLLRHTLLRISLAPLFAMKIFSELILQFGFPGRIIHDQSGEFENALFKKLTELSGVQNLRTTPYHPQRNGIVERMNRTLLGMLRNITGES